MIDTSTIPNSNYKKVLYHQSGDTQDIINVILQADKKNDARFLEFAKQFEPTKAGLKKLWKFTRHQIKYKIDSFGTQDIKFPAALWKAKQGDCKSKTLFINQVLKCLGLDYITRFVKFGKDKDYTHIYSIAILNGQRIVLDSVYEFFNKEAPFSKELDFMTRISTIEGHKNNIGTAEVEDLYYEAEEAALSRYKEIQQRKQYVQARAPINFASLSEGEALLELLIRKLEIIGTMKDEQKATTEKGINLIRNTIETGNKPTGIISDDLQGVAERINYYLSLNGAATGHGYRAKALDFMKRKARESDNFVGRQGMVCLASLWWREQGGAGTTANPFNYSQFSGDAAYNCTSNTKGYLYLARQSTYFFYGRNTAKFRVKYTVEAYQQMFTNIINDTIAQFPGLISPVGNQNQLIYNFANDSVYNALIEELKQGMPVLSNWANDLYRADNTRPDGTVGTGLLYNFVPDLSQIAAISPGNFPSVVQTKMIMQRQFIDSCVNFSTISRTIFDDMAENGVLFDNGGESPERVLSALLLKYNPNIGELTTAMAGLIIGIITAVLAATPTIIDACNNGANDASKIDDAGADASNFGSQSPSTMPNMNDFTPLTQTGGGSGGGTNGSDNKSSLLPWLFLGAGGLWYNNNRKKK